MTTRFTLPRPEGSISTGYSNPDTSDLTIPSCGIEDVDVSVFNLFDKQLPLFVFSDPTHKEANSRKVPVVFAAGEKWAMLKNGNPLRDKSGTLILPIITIMRTGLTQDFSDITGRGINQQTGELYIRRKLDASDRNYQSLINRLLLKDQLNVAVNPGNNPASGQLVTQRKIGDRQDDVDIYNGAYMAPNLKNNIYETLAIPAPQFFTARYEITLWTQYTQQMNSMMEVIMSSFLPQGRSFRLDTPKGYWFVGRIEENYEQDVNFNDMSGAERIIKQKLTLVVPAYLLASSAPGVPIALRRYLSCPQVTFSVEQGPNDVSEYDNIIEDPFKGADDPTLPLQLEGTPRRNDGRDTGQGPLGTRGTEKDPADASYPRTAKPRYYTRNGKKLEKVSSNGETVYRSSELDIVIFK